MQTGKRFAANIAFVSGGIVIK